MCFVQPVKIEIELFPKAIEVMEKIEKETGVSKSELIEKTFLQYIPFDEERAFELIVDDITTRTSQLSDEEKRRVLLRVKELLEKL